jgi:hypothetical protein
MFLDKYQNVHNGLESEFPLNRLPEILSVEDKQEAVLLIYVYLTLRGGNVTAVACCNAYIRISL